MTEELHPFQVEAVEALMHSYSRGKSFALAAMVAEFGKTIMLTHKSELIEQLRTVDYSGVEARLLEAYGFVDYTSFNRRITAEDLKPIYCVREDKPKKDNAPWRRIPHKRGRSKRNRR